MGALSLYADEAYLFWCSVAPLHILRMQRRRFNARNALHLSVSMDLHVDRPVDWRNFYDPLTSLSVFLRTERALGFGSRKQIKCSASLYCLAESNTRWSDVFMIGRWKFADLCMYTGMKKKKHLCTYGIFWISLKFQSSQVDRSWVHPEPWPRRIHFGTRIGGSKSVTGGSLLARSISSSALHLRHCTSVLFRTALPHCDFVSVWLSSHQVLFVKTCAWMSSWLLNRQRKNNVSPVIRECNEHEEIGVHVRYHCSHLALTDMVTDKI